VRSQLSRFRAVFFSAFPTLLEKRAILAIIALHVLAISLPYLWALAITPEGFSYSGLLFNPDDQNVHLSWARQAAEGHFFFRNLFTHESLLSGERPLFTNLLCWLIGALSSLTTIPLVWVYHLLRVIFAVLTLVLFHALSTRLTPDRRVRIMALALVAYSSGAGFLAPFFPGRDWMDRADNPDFPMMPEAFTFTSSYIFTLNMASLTLLLATYLLCLHAFETASKKAAIGAGLTALLLANIHTYDVFPLLLALSWWAVDQFRSFPRARFLFLPLVYIGAFIPVLYQLFVFRFSEEFRIKALTKTLAPALSDILISYGPMILLAVAGGVFVWRETSQNKMRMQLPILWAISTLLCIYAPVSFARKMIEGLHLPLCFLAAMGIVAILSKLQSQNLRRVAAAGVLLLLSLSSLQLIQWTLKNAQDNNAERAGVLMPPLYLATSDLLALRFLKNQPRGKVVLCLPYVGNYVPRESGQTAFVGHWAETLYFHSDVRNKVGETFAFYKGTMPSNQARAWLRENRINYVMIGSYEKRLGLSLPLELPIAHEESGTTIYAVPPATRN